MAPVLSPVLELLENQIDVVEGAESVFQQVQRMLPLPSASELAEMRKGLRPVNRTVYLLWFLQRAFLSLEEVANGLRVEREDGLAEVQIETFGTIQFNYVDQAIAYVREAGALKAAEKIVNSGAELSLALKVLRVIRGWTQDDLAKASGTPAGSIADYERGTKVPSLKLLERLLLAMGYSIQSLQCTRRLVQTVRSEPGKSQATW